jgi:hypothetical protein
VIARLMLGRQAGSVGIQGPGAMGITLWTICASVPAPFHFNRSLESGYTGHIISFESPDTRSRAAGERGGENDALLFIERCAAGSGAETHSNIAVIAAALDRS